MLKKNRVLKGALIALGIFLGATVLPSQTTYAESTENETADSIKVSTNGDLDAAQNATEFIVDGTGEMTFTPEPEITDSGKEVYKGNIAAAYVITTD
jgi:hypothetical protein